MVFQEVTKFKISKSSRGKNSKKPLENYSDCHILYVLSTEEYNSNSLSKIINLSQPAIYRAMIKMYKLNLLIKSEKLKGGYYTNIDEISKHFLKFIIKRIEQRIEFYKKIKSDGGIGLKEGKDEWSHKIDYTLLSPIIKNALITARMMLSATGCLFIIKDELFNIIRIGIDSNHQEFSKQIEDKISGAKISNLISISNFGENDIIKSLFKKFK
jgi:DNA-binding transcriptional ArsR family regulator